MATNLLWDFEINLFILDSFVMHDLGLFMYNPLSLIININLIG